MSFIWASYVTSCIEPHYFITTFDQFDSLNNPLIQCWKVSPLQVPLPSLELRGNGIDIAVGRSHYNKSSCLLFLCKPCFNTYIVLLKNFCCFSPLYKWHWIFIFFNLPFNYCHSMNSCPRAQRRCMVISPLSMFLLPYLWYEKYQTRGIHFGDPITRQGNYAQYMHFFVC